MNRFLFLVALCAAACALRAQTPPAALDTLVVSANGVPQDPAALPNDLTVLRPADLWAQQTADLPAALAEVPGVTVTDSGARGAQGSVFLRGANSDQTLFVVDGVRLNTPADSYSNFLGSAGLAGLDRIEVLLGPQSTVYGSSAAGGVIRLDTAYGSGMPSVQLAAEGGSFGTFDASVTSSGAEGGTGYSVAVDRLETNNQRPYNAFADRDYSGRLEDRIEPWLLAGVTFRGDASHYEEPGPTPTDYPDEGVVQADTDLGTAYVEVSQGDRLKARVTAGRYQDEYTFDDGDAYDFYQSRNTREVLAEQTTWTPFSGLQVVAGYDGEWNRYWAGTPATDRLTAGYVLAAWSPLAGLDLSAGLRRDDYSMEGGATTGRAGVAYRPGNGSTKLRATYGTAFEAPTPSDRFGSPPYVLPNPAVRPERSRGWDAGVDQAVKSAKSTFSATVFGNRFTDLLEYEVVNYLTYAGEEINVDRALSRGLELSVQSQPVPMLRTHLAYTYLSALDDVSGARLLRRPRHTLDGSADIQASSAFSIGAGVHLVADNYDELDVPAPLGGYTTVRLYARYRLNSELSLTVRMENVLDRQYEEVAGYPALGRGIYGGVQWRL